MLSDDLKHIGCVNNGITYIWRNLDVRFPNYKNVIPPKTDNELTVGAKTLSKLYKRHQAFMNKATYQVAVRVNADGAEVYTEDLDFELSMKSTIDGAKYKGKDMEIGLNFKLWDKLASFTDGCLNMNMTAPNRAVTVNDCMLIMPVMLGN
jgi:DNA polymerase-3 subunit beta